MQIETHRAPHARVVPGALAVVVGHRERPLVLDVADCTFDGFLALPPWALALLLAEPTWHA